MAESSPWAEPTVAVRVVGCRERVTRLATRNILAAAPTWVRFAWCSHGGSAGRSGAGGASKCMRRECIEERMTGTASAALRDGEAQVAVLRVSYPACQNKPTHLISNNAVCGRYIGLHLGRSKGAGVCATPHARRGQVTVYQHSTAQRGTAANVVVVVGGGERMGSPIEREPTWVMTMGL
jgi:hypothetical protein